MEQKRVSFKVAKAIKEAGYPQELDVEHLVISWKGYIGTYDEFDYDENLYACPTYLDVWIWLWRKKNVRIYTRNYFGGLAVLESSSSYDSISHTDPEDAIVATIEYLVDNDLIK